MGNGKKEKSTLQVVSDWWNAKPEPVVPYKVRGKPVTNPPADRRTLQRTTPAPTLTYSEALANIWNNTRPLDFTRDLIKGVYQAGKSVVTDPKGSISSAAKAAGTFEGIMAARESEQTGRWPKPEGAFSLMTPAQLANWRREGLANYRKLASHYSYIDKNGKRQTDNAALMRNLTQRPMEVLPILFGGASKVGQLAQATKIKPLITAGKVVEGLSKAGDIVTNPAPYAIAKTVKSVSPVVSAGLKKAGVTPTVFTEVGDYSPKMQQAFKDAGIDPALFNSPEMREIVQGVINEKGISPAAIKEAALRSQSVSPSRSMTTGEMPLTDQERAFRSQANQGLAQNMQNNVESAYQQATSHRGFFTNTSDFSSGVRKSVDDELAALGLSIDDVLKNSRFEETRRALQGSKGFPGVFDQFDDLSGKRGAAPLSAEDLSGGTHTFDYGKKQWVDASGTPVTAPGKIQYLDLVSNRQNISPPIAGPNRLTPQSIDSVRRNVSSRFNNAQGDDATALAAINRGIDNYTVQNASNFTGDGVAMAKDWDNARKTSQLARGYGRVPEADPFASPNPPVPFDPDAVARTQAARGIVQAEPDLKNTTPPTIFQRIRDYAPSVGAGQVLGYNLGAATGIPGAGLLGGSVLGAGTKFVRNSLDDANANRIAQSESAGAPNAPLFQAPDVRVPAGIAGAAATTAQSDYQTPVTAAPKPVVPAAPLALPDVVTEDEYQASLRPQAQSQGASPSLPEVVTEEEYQDSLRPQPQANGGRAAYKTGGKVGGIEPLIQALMNKAKMAKKVSNKATEPLLKERDDAIASALAVAQKAI
jgi:hypothetical protein